MKYLAVTVNFVQVRQELVKVVKYGGIFLPIILCLTRYIALNPPVTVFCQSYAEGNGQISDEVNTEFQMKNDPRNLSQIYLVTN